jgi:hypothetical protein
MKKILSTVRMPQYKCYEDVIFEFNIDQVDVRYNNKIIDVLTLKKAVQLVNTELLKLQRFRDRIKYVIAKNEIKKVQNVTFFNDKNCYEKTNV